MLIKELIKGMCGVDMIVWIWA